MRRSGRFRGYSVRRAKRPGPLVVMEVTCSGCSLRFTEEHTERFWVSADRWRVLVGDCPECHTEVQFVVGLVA